LRYTGRNAAHWAISAYTTARVPPDPYMASRNIRFLLFVLVAIAVLAACSFAASKPNIVLITLDSVRADRAGFVTPGKGTPNVHDVARQSLVFEQAYAQSPVTVVSHATI